MPKPKRKADTSDSDSGPDDREPEKKKPASSKPASKSGSKEEPSWQIDKMKFAKVREFRGKVYVDVREYYEKDGELLPGKKGVSLSAQQWNKLKDVIPEIDKALSEM